MVLMVFLGIVCLELLTGIAHSVLQTYAELLSGIICTIKKKLRTQELISVTKIMSSYTKSMPT